MKVLKTAIEKRTVEVDVLLVDVRLNQRETLIIRGILGNLGGNFDNLKDIINEATTLKVSELELKDLYNAFKSANDALR